MKVYRENFVVTAPASSFYVTSTTIQTGHVRIYEGRCVVNVTSARGTMVSYLNSQASGHILGVAQLATSTGIVPNVGIAEEAGHRHYMEGEYWTFWFFGFTTGDVVYLSLMGTEVTVFEYAEKRVIPT